MLNIDPATILWTVVNLLVLFLLLRHFLFRPVTKLMDDRSQAIQEDLSTAEQNRAETEKLKQTYAEQLAQARGEAAQIVAQAKQRGEREYQALLEKADLDAGQLRAQVQAQLEAEREAMLEGVRQEAAALVLMAAGKVSGQVLDSQQDMAMVDAFLAEAGEIK